ncbi:porin family protein [Porphyrobacter sp. YT40]|uniref:outer membrane protein n=1 Tax=Porphyrobacter sp. YT40 TaxID=2547601 RepID=UPI0011418B71|nr:porin family protein [Porphyrobacter sp. YT40]QDH32903.1 porin family protein [Porphyrobacter sp. YT40]
MNKLSVAMVLGAAVVAMPAAAQDSGSNGGGFFVGAVGGLDVINLEVGAESDAESGAVYGVIAGYDIKSGSALLGIEAELTDTSISDGVGNAGLDIYGGLRLGLDMDENDIIYLKAGYSRVDVDLADDLEGVRVGAGFEHNFGGFVGRLEYRYSTYNVGEVLGLDANDNRHQVVVAAGFKF